MNAITKHASNRKGPPWVDVVILLATAEGLLWWVGQWWVQSWN